MTVQPPEQPLKPLRFLARGYRHRVYARLGTWQVEVGKPWVPFSVRVLGRPDRRPRPLLSLLGGRVVVVRIPPYRKDAP